MQINIFRKMKLTSKLIVLFGIFASLMVLLISFLTYQKYYNYLISSNGERASAAVVTLAYLIDGDKAEYYLKSQVIDEEYEKIVHELDYLKQKIDVTFLYVMCPTDEENVIFIYDASDVGDGVENSEEDRELLGNPGINNDTIKLILSGKKDVPLLTISNTVYGFLATSYAPLINSSNRTIGVVCIDISMNEIMSELKNYVLTSFAIIIAIIAASLLTLLFIIKGTIIAPINNIAQVSENFVKENYEKIEIKTIEINGKDEINMLADAFNKMMIDIKKYTENIKKVTIEKQKISSELGVAEKIRKSMIPSIFPVFPEISEIDIYANMISEGQVGGDFYDLFLIDKIHLAFVIADVSGKGVSAALFMVIAKTLIKNQFDFNLDPGLIFEKINNQMCKNNELGMFFTAFLGILNLNTGEIVFSNAGHTLPVATTRNGDFGLLKNKKNPAIAGIPDLKFKSEKINLNPNDLIFLYTDGLIEASNSKGEFWSTKKLLRSLNSIDASAASPKEITDVVKSEVKNFADKSLGIDDITMLVIKYNGKKGDAKL